MDSRSDCGSGRILAVQEEAQEVVMGITYSVGLVGVAVGGYLIDCAIQNRPPIGTLVAILRSPSDLRGILASQKRPADSFAPQGDWSGPAQSGAGPGAGSWGENSQADTAIAFARSQIGKPYVWGGTGPNGWDCSGLVQAAYKAAGINLPRVTQAMILTGTGVSQANLMPGDLVFPDIGHVQIYTNNGNVVEAPSAGHNVREVAMWGFMTARRVAIFAPAAPATAAPAAVSA